MTVPVVSEPILNGIASRLAKSRWLMNDSVSSEAFDLRDGTPPETYVSFFMCQVTHLSQIEAKAVSEIGTRISIRKGNRIMLIDVAEALDEVNHEAEIISFLPKGLPHCGLFYLTDDAESIVEAKATLSLLATTFLVDEHV